MYGSTAGVKATEHVDIFDSSLHVARLLVKILHALDRVERHACLLSNAWTFHADALELLDGREELRHIHDIHVS